jgi:2-succinyl-5-enolpyruvyl-6-hydroxy-3-cyclohexene-1-carboxylate synthase
MYTEIKNQQILIALLKKHSIHHLVISPGARMKDFAFSVESDPYFTCYSVVDERSAAYFALGVAQAHDEPAAIVCTSSTATCNYLPGITEAFYQRVPLLIITGDQDPRMLGQLQDQMIRQIDMYRDVVKKSVTLPIVQNNDDAWYCERLINEALLELRHHDDGPVHINVPVLSHSQPLTVKELLPVTAISRIALPDDDEALRKTITELRNAGKILIIAGQNTPLKARSIEKSLSRFFEKYNCAIHAEYMGNIHIKGSVNLSALGSVLSDSAFDAIMPEIVISFGGNIGVYGLKGLLRQKHFTHWLVSETGAVIDGFKNLRTVFECSPERFFSYCADNAPENTVNDEVYYNALLSLYRQIKTPDLPWSNVFVIQQFLSKLPEGTLLHLSILNSIRISHFFELPAGTQVYANIGTDGIDGCMSSFLGQALTSDQLAFLLIGDLSFFYDMSSIRIRHIKNNVRILLINNHGGGEFYIGPRTETLDQHIAAKHNVSAKGWIESVGFTYISLKTKEDLLSCLAQFVKPESDRPIVLEVFTDMKTDADAVNMVFETNRGVFNTNAVDTLKRTIRSVLGEDGYTTIKNTVKQILKK